MKSFVFLLLLAAMPVFAQQTGGGGVPGSGGSASLPTATAAGQTLAATGAGSTYAAGGTIAPIVPIPTVSTAQPTYVVAAFRDDVQSTYFQYSDDATNWVSGGAAPITPAGGGYVVRDVDWLFYPANSTYYFYSTGGPNSFNTFSSTNLTTFSAQTAITVGTNIYDWRPTHVQDTSGNYYMYIGTATSGPTPTTIQVSQFTPGGSYGTWNTVTLNSESTCSSGMFDFRVIYNASNTTYYGFYACQQGGTTQYIHVATASTPTGPFTRINTGVNDPYSFGSSSENPDLIVLPSGNVRLMADTWVNIGASGRVYTRKYVDTSGNFGTVIGSPVRVGGPESEGGTNITVTSQAVANTIFTAINHLPASAANNVMSPIGIDGPGYDPYSIAIWVPCAISGQNCNSLGAGTPSLGMQNPIDNSWSTLNPYNVAGGVGFSIQSYASGNQTALALDGSTQVNGKKWVLLNQSGIFAPFDSSDSTTPCMTVGVQTSFINLFGCSSLTTMGWNAQSEYVNATITLDTGFSRDAAGVIDVGNGTQGSKTGLLKAAGFINAGTTFTVAGCGTATALVGGSTAGKFVGGSATCSPVITTGITAPNGYACQIQDQTTSTAVFRQTAYTTTTATFTGSGTIGATDTLVFGCQPF